MSAAALILLAAWAVSFSDAAVLSTILTNGPTTNRLNVVFLSEGYTSSQSGLFLSDATNAMNILLSRPPLTEYQSYLNGFAIWVASAQAGSDHPPTLVNTYFNSSFSGTLITIPSDSTGQGKVDSLVATYAPWADLRILLVNDPVSGGSGGTNLAIVSTGDYGLEDHLVHEVGHTLAGLGDEYDSFYDFPSTTEEPNTTQQTNRTLLKWKAWINPATPIPTLAGTGYDYGVVGLFQGAHYHTTNWYRPEYDCLMRSTSPYVDFCHVCSETMVLSFYRCVRPVDSFAPASTNLTLTNLPALSFSVTNLQPATHSLSVQWSTNGVAVTNATNAVFTLQPQSLGGGTNRIQAVVKDGTPLVRNDPTNLLSQTITWSVNVPALSLLSPRWLGSNCFRLTITGNAPNGFSLHASTNLSNWFPLLTNYPATNPFTLNYTNTGATNKWRFYRARTPPSL